MRTICYGLMAAFVLLAPSLAQAGSREVQYGPAPEWVIAPPAPTDGAPPPGAPAQVIYSDTQTRLEADQSETYSAFRIKILTSAGLRMGNMGAVWNPSTDDLIVHQVRIIRGDQIINVLDQASLQVIQRENNLESAMLDGELTASLQTPGLRVGDEIEFSNTVRRRDTTFANRSGSLMQYPLVGSTGAYRFRLLWPEDLPVYWRASPDLGEIRPVSQGNVLELLHEVRDPVTAVITEGAPARFNVQRFIQYSRFSDWSDVSRAAWPLFEQALVLAPDSSLREEAAKISAQTADPVKRVEAALRLVQEEVRYFYIGLDGGNYRPASADETWERRFGDCKAKTVLLLALLRELGVESEAVLVSSLGGDGTDQYLPTPLLFDHMLVKVTLESETYWLDGTRPGDRRLAMLPEPAFSWALPLRADNTELEAVVARPSPSPQTIRTTTIDASAGLDAPAKVTYQDILRGDVVYEIRTALSSLTPADADQTVRNYWRERVSGEILTATWRYDSELDLIVLSMTGEEELDWDGDRREGWSYRLPGAGFSPPARFQRPPEQNQDAPWLTDFPRFSCWVTTMMLPAPAMPWRWDYVAAPVDRRLAGVAYWREASLRGNVMRTVMSRQNFVPEITADEAREANENLANFDNLISFVFQALPDEPTTGLHVGPAASFEDIDWAGPNPPCANPGGDGTLAR